MIITIQRVITFVFVVDQFNILFGNAQMYRFIFSWLQNSVKLKRFFINSKII